ncbi:MAG: antibiotic ABC transporter [Streptosporangiales bacterium]|nr:antibiotic ABC transporter [Streptosporangiales bacterium]
MTTLTGTAGLVRLILRRDRFLLPLWLLLPLTIVLGRAGTVGSTYPTARARQERFEQVLDIPMFLLFQSRAFDSTPGALVAQEAFAGTTLACAIGAILFVVRHTRSEEQAGRRELLGATVVGRHAPLTAAVSVVTGAGLVLAVVIAGGLVAMQLPVLGSVTFAAVALAAVVVAASLAAVLVQVTTSVKLAAFGAIGVFYVGHLVRGVSDMGGSGLVWLGWLSPSGWLEHVRPFAGERLWPFALVVAFATVLLAAAYVLSTRRDLAGGLLPERLAAGTVTPVLRGPLGLAWRLHRGMAVGWATVLACCALGTGYAGGAGAMSAYAKGAWLREYAAAMGVSPSAAFFVYVAFLLGLIVAFYAVLTTLRMRTEEELGHAETVLAAPAGRTRWAASHLVFAMAVPVVLLAILGLGAGVGGGLSAGDLPGQVVSMLGLTVGIAPAIWVLVGVGVAAYGVFGRGTAVIAWLALAVMLGVEIAVHWGLPQWVFRLLSPFAHVNPFYERTAVTYLALTMVAAALTGVGLWSLRRRDIASS